MLVLGYARISSQDRERELSIEAQIARLEAAGATQIYWDQQSGDDDGRPQYQALLARIEAEATRGAVEVWATRLDRLSRNDKELERAIEWLDSIGARFRALDGGYYSSEALHDWLRLKNEALFAQYWVRQTSLAVRRRQAQKRAAGQPVMARCPIGYRRSADRTRLEPDPETAPLVRAWFETYLAGASVREVERLTEGRLKTSGVFSMLHNPVYRGHLRYSEGGQTRKEGRAGKKKPKVLRYNCHEAIISEAEYGQIEARAAENKRLWGHSFKGERYPLQGLVVCATCGYRCVKNRGRGGRYYAFCKNQFCPEKKMCRHEAIEAAIQNEISEAAEAISLLVEQQGRADPRVLKLEHEAEQLRPLAHREAIALEIARIEAEIEQLKSASEVEALGSAERRALVQAWGEASPEDWEQLTPEERRAIYADLVESVRIAGREILEVRLRV